MVINNDELTIGFVPTTRMVFDREDALLHRELILKKIKTSGYKIVDINDINEEGMLVTDDDVNKVIKKLKDTPVDCFFTPHCNFGSESAVAKVARVIDKPLLLWGPRDGKPLDDG